MGADANRTQDADEEAEQQQQPQTELIPRELGFGRAHARQYSMVSGLPGSVPAFYPPWPDMSPEVGFACQASAAI